MKRTVAVLLILCLLLPAAGVNAEDVHFALRSRDVGACKKLLGDVMILVVFVNTPQHPWTDAQRDAVYRVSYSSLDYIRKDAKKYRADLRPTLGFLEFDVSTEYSDDLGWYWEIIHNVYGENSIVQVYDRYRKDLNVDEAPIIFMFNSWDLSHTYTSYVDYPGWDEEFCVIFCDTKMHNNYLTHELYHQFGAIDLYDYNNEGVERRANKYFGKTTMGCTGSGMDDLNAYLMGWTDTLSSNAKKFLKETEGLR